MHTPGQRDLVFHENSDKKVLPDRKSQFFLLHVEAEVRFFATSTNECMRFVIIRQRKI